MSEMDDEFRPPPHRTKKKRKSETPPSTLQTDLSDNFGNLALQDNQATSPDYEMPPPEFSLPGAPSSRKQSPLRAFLAKSQASDSSFAESGSGHRVMSASYPFSRSISAPDVARSRPSVSPEKPSKTMKIHYNQSPDDDCDHIVEGHPAYFDMPDDVLTEILSYMNESFTALAGMISKKFAVIARSSLRNLKLGLSEHYETALMARVQERFGLRVEHLHITSSFHAKLGAPFLEQIVRYSNLKTLTLRQIGLDTSISLQVLSLLPSLTSLHFSGCAIGAQELTFLNRADSTLLRLKEFSYEMKTIDTSLLNTICNSLSNLEYLSVKISTPEDLANICKLTTLRVLHIDTLYDTLSLLAPKPGQQSPLLLLPRLENLEVFRCGGLRQSQIEMIGAKMKSLRSLTFTNVPVGETDQMLRSLARNWRKLRTLRIYAVSSNALQDSQRQFKINWDTALELHRLFTQLELLDLQNVLLSAPPHTANILGDFKRGFRALKTCFFNGQEIV